MLEPMSPHEIGQFFAPSLAPGTSDSAVVGVFSNRLDAEYAIAELEAAGFTSDHIGFVVRGEEPWRAGKRGLLDSRLSGDAEGMVDGLITGGIVGGVLATAVSILVPPIGPIVVGGVLASFFGGTLAGMAVGGIIGALTNLGFSEQQSRAFQAEFEAGKAIVAVRAGARSPEAAEILSRYGGSNIHSPLTRDDSKAFFDKGLSQGEPS